MRFKLVVVAVAVADVVVFALVVVVVVFVIELFTKLLPKEILWTCWFVGRVQPNAECQSIQKQKRLKIMQKLG